MGEYHDYKEAEGMILADRQQHARGIKGARENSFDTGVRAHEGRRRKPTPTEPQRGYSPSPDYARKEGEALAAQRQELVSDLSSLEKKRRALLEQRKMRENEVKQRMASQQRRQPCEARRHR